MAQEAAGKGGCQSMSMEEVVSHAKETAEKVTAQFPKAEVTASDDGWVKVKRGRCGGSCSPRPCIQQA